MTSCASAPCKRSVASLEGIPPRLLVHRYVIERIRYMTAALTVLQTRLRTDGRRALTSTALFITTEPHCQSEREQLCWEVRHFEAILSRLDGLQLFSQLAKSRPNTNSRSVGDTSCLRNHCSLKKGLHRVVTASWTPLPGANNICVFRPQTCRLRPFREKDTHLSVLQCILLVFECQVGTLFPLTIQNTTVSKDYLCLSTTILKGSP